MDKHELTVIDLEQLAALMAHALPDLECPECCGPVYEFIEVGARFHNEQLEWAYFARVLVHGRSAKKSHGGGS